MTRWLGGSSHSQFNSRYFHIVHRCENASCIQFSTVTFALSTAILIFSTKLFSMTSSWRALFSPTAIFPQSVEQLLVSDSKVSFHITLAMVLLPMTKLFKVSLNWLRCLLRWRFFLRLDTILCKQLSWNQHANQHNATKQPKWKIINQGKFLFQKENCFYQTFKLSFSADQQESCVNCVFVGFVSKKIACHLFWPFFDRVLSGDDVLCRIVK